MYSALATGGLLAEHVVDEDFRQLLVLAAGGDAHGVNEVVGGFGVVELQVHVLRLGLGMVK